MDCYRTIYHFVPFFTEFLCIWCIEISPMKNNEKYIATIEANDSKGATAKAAERIKYVLMAGKMWNVCEHNIEFAKISQNTFKISTSKSELQSIDSVLLSRDRNLHENCQGSNVILLYRKYNTPIKEIISIPALFSVHKDLFFQFFSFSALHPTKKKHKRIRIYSNAIYISSFRHNRRENKNNKNKHFFSIIK